MTVEVKYNLQTTQVASGWQVAMAEQIESNRGFPINSIERELSGTMLTVRVDTSLPSTAVEDMLSDIEDYVPAGSQHIETREVQE